MKRKILVTGLGAVSAAGLTVEENIRTLSSGTSAVRPEPALLRTRLAVPVGEVGVGNARLKECLGIVYDVPVTRTALLALLAAREAVEDAGLDSSALSGGRTGFILGTSVGGMDLTEDFYEEFRHDCEAGGDIRMIKMHDCGASTDFVAKRLGIKGFTITVSTACSSAGNAIMLGARMISAGLLDTVIAGGADALSRFTMNGFNSLRILSASLCRPFDISRDGLNLGEGAGFMVLQSASSLHGGSVPYCELSGWAGTDEAYHQTGTSADGEGAFNSMSQALEKAGLEPSMIDYVNTHGTGTPGNDLAEGTAIHRLFGAEARYGSFKGYIGHTLAASEGIEAVFCAVMLKENRLWPSLGFSDIDPAIGTGPYMASGEGISLKHIVSNSFGFGGNNSSLVFSKTDDSNVG